MMSAETVTRAWLEQARAELARIEAIDGGGS